MRKDIIIGSGIFVIGVGGYMVFRHLKRKKELMEAIDYLDGFYANRDAGKKDVINKEYLTCMNNHKLTDKNKFYQLYTERAKGYKAGKTKEDTIIVGGETLNISSLKDVNGRIMCGGVKKDKYIKENCETTEKYGEDCLQKLTNYKKK